MDKCTEKIRKGRGRVNRTPKKCKKPAWNEEKGENDTCELENNSKVIT